MVRDSAPGASGRRAAGGGEGQGDPHKDRLLS